MDTGLLAVALLAGAVATFNPCGFALLPAYLAVLVSGGSPSRSGHRPSASAPGAADSTARAVGRAVRFAAGMTLGFVGVFGLAGLAVAAFAVSFERWLPVLTVVIGFLLVAAGGWLLSGRTLGLPGLTGRGQGPTDAWASTVTYGSSFALASLSCTLAPFLAVTSASLRDGQPIDVVAAFVVYALGMGAVVLLLALTTAVAGSALTARVRRAGALINRGSGLLLVVAGAYVAWYGWFELRVLAGANGQDAVVSVATGVQASLVRAVIGLGAPGVALLGTALLGVLVTYSWVRRAHQRKRQDRAAQPRDDVDVGR
ncbi:MAG: cytochrome c biogenesis CcdA family protein [Actinomycetota bacterium]|nr:cytochrome c biogenesis CcdA family protein [Actinomycetota bacterium]MDQ3415936.1 cytochrome c biogenesis CcdA family protein [Actinomycetota bacterium]